MNVEKIHKELKKRDLEVVIGLETHIRLNTKTKLFCGCKNIDAEKPNQNICSICTGQMGVLPALNREAVLKTILFGKIVESSFSNKIISWDRKHYEYPDLPKNYQITQFYEPIVTDGKVNCFRDDGSILSVPIEQTHLEEDAAKLIHKSDYSLVDFNKSGVPLIEVVTKPSINNINDVYYYAQHLHRLVQTYSISDANLEKGEFKSDVSVSIRNAGSTVLNSRTEIKNLNSFRFMLQALCDEVQKQIDYFDKNMAFRPNQVTALFDSESKKTNVMRKKEASADYRYLKESDIPPVDIRKVIDEITIDERIKPFNFEQRLINGGVKPQDVKYFSGDKSMMQFFSTVLDELNSPLFISKIFTNTDGFSHLKIKDIDVFIALLKKYKNDEISKKLFQEAIILIGENSKFDLNKFIEENTLSEEQIEEAIETVLNSNENLVNSIKDTNDKRLNILVGKALSLTNNRESGKRIKRLIIEKLLGYTAQVKDESISNNEQINKKNESNIEYNGLLKDVISLDVYRTHLISELIDNEAFGKVTLSGWVENLRDHGDIIFIDLRDSSSEILQVAFSGDIFVNIDQISKIRSESLIRVSGKLSQRNKNDINKSIKTGEIELRAESLEIINKSKNLPFDIRNSLKVNENIRFEYKFLDHRNIKNRVVFENRYKVIKHIRDFLDSKSFIEFETPILTSGTDEGAREFIIPSRKYIGKFYTLPQAPQQFKQVLMASGYDKYFQIARCFRDEDTRGDRQPEFTQLDLEMAFVKMDQIIELNSELLISIINEIYHNKWKLKPFKTITYKDAIECYGTDRPDLRYGLKLIDITHIVKKSKFKVFTNVIDSGGVVKCLKVSKEDNKGLITKGLINKLTNIAQINGLGGLAYISITENELVSPIIKFLGGGIAANIVKKVGGEAGDIIFFGASNSEITNKALGIIRQELGEALGLRKQDELHPLWVIDFPFFEKNEDGKWSFTHNPFSMPKVEDIEKHLKGDNIEDIIAQQYDLVINGYEIGGGSVRAHKEEILEATYKIMGYSELKMKESIGPLLKAFQYGTPPHAGIAWGLDRLLMILENKSSIREVMAFPKTGTGIDLLFRSPSVLSNKTLNDYKLFK